MNTVRDDSWSFLNDFQSRLNKLVEQQQQWETGDQSNVVTSQWRPAVDIKEEQDRFVLFADVPGIDPKEIEITMENGILTIKGQRTLSDRENAKEYSRVERVYGQFYRRFSLPDTANPEAIQARGEHGVLTITIPKQQKAQPRRIEVKVQ